MDTISEELLTPEELADKLKVKRSWVYEQMRRRDGFPHIRVGRYLRFSYPEVMAFLASGSVQPPPRRRKSWLGVEQNNG